MHTLPPSPPPAARYFESDLYKGVMLSTHPPTHTPNMSSWFPIFFPLKVSGTCTVGRVRV